MSPTSDDEIERLATWALLHADGHWRSPDHFVSSRTADPKSAKPFFGEKGRYDAEGFAAIIAGSKVVPHPHPEVFGGRAPTKDEIAKAEGRRTKKPRRPSRR